MKKIIFVNLDRGVAPVLKRKLEEVPGLTVLRANNIAEIAVNSFQQDQSVLVIYTKGVLNREEALGKSTWEIAKHLPVIICAGIVDISLFELVSSSKQIRIFENGIGLRNLIQIIYKTFKNEKVVQPRHRRFPTNEQMIINVFGKNQIAEGRMINLSRGGASVLLDTNLDIETKDLLRLTVNLNEAGKVHNISAEVVWVRNEPSLCSMGIAFLDQQEWYNRIVARST